MVRKDSVESAVKTDIEELGDLAGVEPTLAAVAGCLAAAIDKAAVEDPRILPALTRELRITMKALADGQGGDEDDDDAELGTPA